MHCPHCYANEGYQHSGWCPTQASLARVSQFGQAGLNQIGQAGLNQMGQAQANRALWAPTWPREPMTPADLGIVDQNLDDKVGMDL